MAYTPSHEFPSKFSRQRGECKRRAMRLWEHLDEIVPKPSYFDLYAPLVTNITSNRRVSPRKTTSRAVLFCVLPGIIDDCSSGTQHPLAVGLTCRFHVG